MTHLERYTGIPDGVLGSQLHVVTPAAGRPVNWECVFGSCSVQPGGRDLTVIQTFAAFHFLSRHTTCPEAPLLSVLIIVDASFLVAVFALPAHPRPVLHPAGDGILLEWHSVCSSAKAWPCPRQSSQKPAWPHLMGSSPFGILRRHRPSAPAPLSHLRPTGPTRTLGICPWLLLLLEAFPAAHPWGSSPSLLEDSAQTSFSP